MKKLLIVLTVAGTVSLGALAAAADPPVTNPGEDCSHGNSGQTCVPDPQPDHGKDCDQPNGDGNEDHCLTTTTSTGTATTSTTEPPTTTITETTTTTSPTTTTSTVPPETTTTSETVVPPTTSEPPSSTTTPAPPASDTGSNTTEPKPGDKSETERPGKLAFTGAEDVVPIGVAAVLLLLVGSGLAYRFRSRDE